MFRLRIDTMSIMLESSSKIADIDWRRYGNLGDI